MDYTKCREFIAFSHIVDKDRYWINQGWLYSDDCPGLFCYHTSEDKKTAKDVYESYINNWKLKGVEAVVLKIDKIEKFKIDKIKIDSDKSKSKEISDNSEKKVRKPRKNKNEI